MKLSLAQLLVITAATTGLVSTLDAQVVSIKTKEDLDKINKPAIVRFYAPWCGACKATSQVYEKLSNDEAAKNITFVAINVDEARELAQNYDISGIPTFIYINKDNKNVYTAIGAPQGGEDAFIQSFKQQIEKSFNISMSKQSESMFAKATKQIKKGFKLVSNKLQSTFGIA